MRMISKRLAAVDDMGNAGGECALIAREVDRQPSDFLGGTEPPHRLAAHEHLAAAWACGGGRVAHRRRFDPAGPSAPAAHPGGDGLVGDALTFERRETFLVDIGCKDSGTLARKGDCRGAADAGRSGGDEGAFALEAVWHVFSRDLSVSYAGLTRVSIALEE